MIKRTISGAVYVAIIVGFFLLRQFVDYRLFDILLWAFCGIGTFEVARAVKGYLKGNTFILSVIYGVAFVPVFCTVEWIFAGVGYIVCLSLFGVAFVYEIIYAIVKKTGFSSCITNILPFMYPSLLILTMLLANEFSGLRGYVAMLVIFVNPPFADTFAYLFGMSVTKLKKGNTRKMCPNLSPNKTWVGAAGGLFGGMVGTILIANYVGISKIIYSPLFPLIIMIAIVFVFSELEGIFEYFSIVVATIIVFLVIAPRAGGISVFIFFLSLGLLISALTIIGDLFESYIKRKTGLKDMGNIMPGHGGIMDRIDGMLFAGFGTFVVFNLIQIA